MAKKPHKFAGNGLHMVTDLSATELREICALASTESKGDLWKGRQKLEKAESGEDWDTWVIKNALNRTKVLVFTVRTVPQSDGQRTVLRADIQWYVTTQQKMMLIPVGPKTMVAHHTFMQFVNKVANTVQGADPTANITIRSGAVTA
jgi:hypothetical protein